jgi:hypothetical protein
MTNTQIIVQFLGWGLLIYLHNRTLRRAEIARLKESLTQQINELAVWLTNKLDEKKTNSTNNKIDKNQEKVNFLKIESLLTAKAVQLDLKLLQLNQYSRITLLTPSLLSPLRDIDINNLIYNQNVEVEISELTAELIEQIETSYANKLFNINYFRYVYLYRKPEMLGVIFAIFLLSISYHLVKIIFQ